MAAKAPIVIVFGVSGCGKTTVGKQLARRFDAAFLEGDDFHSAQNIEKMKAGIPLTDADRGPWLAAIAKVLETWKDQNQSGVVACSALKRRYRDRLRGQSGDIRLVYLRGAQELIARRLATRKGHFMPPDLLQSQFDALEEPEPNERALILDIEASPEALVEEAVRWLKDEGDQSGGK